MFSLSAYQLIAVSSAESDILNDLKVLRVNETNGEYGVATLWGSNIQRHRPGSATLSSKSKKIEIDNKYLHGKSKGWDRKQSMSFKDGIRN